MRVHSSLRAAMAGALAGLVGALVFAAAHAVIIVPIWDRMTSGLIFGAVAGAAGAWAYHELYRGLDPRATMAILRGAAFGASLWLAVAPITVVDAILRAIGFLPRFELVGVVVAVALAIGAGASWGWRRTRRKRAAISVAAATLALTIAMAGPVPIGRSVWALAIWIAVLPSAVLGGVIVALANAVAERRMSNTLMAPR